MARIAFVRDASPHADAIGALLERTDDEFHPPLSVRTGPTQTAGLDERRTDGLDDYLDSCLEQPFVLALDGDRLAGFLSVRPGYRIDALSEYAPSTYASTLVVHPDDRRQGYARRLYHALLTDLPEVVRDPYVTTRTWSENEAHRRLLDELGFDLVTRIPDDRGEGIDTVYYGIDVADYP